MAWIESHQNLPRHQKLARLAGLLQIHKGMAFWHLHNLWYWALDYAQDGVLDGFSDDEICDASVWTGDKDTFLESLRKSGWVDSGSEGWVLHDWNDYAGKLIDARVRNRARMRNARATHVQDTCNARAEHLQRTCGATSSTQPTQPTAATVTSIESAAAALSSFGFDKAAVTAIMAESSPTLEQVQSAIRACDMTPGVENRLGFVRRAIADGYAPRKISEKRHPAQAKAARDARTDAESAKRREAAEAAHAKVKAVDAWWSHLDGTDRDTAYRAIAASGLKGYAGRLWAYENRGGQCRSP